MATVRYSLVMAELKKSLKRQGTSYAELARQLDVPESTLKKWFNAKDGSFNRIDMICEAMGLSIFGVIRNAEEQNVQTFTFSDAQQKYFMKDKEAFAIYWLVVYERLSTTEVMEKLRIEKSVLNKALLRLDKIGLVQLGADDNLRIPKMRPIRWKFEGEFMIELLREWVTEIFQDNLTNKKDSMMMLQFFQLTPQYEEELKRDIALLEEKYARRTILELKNPEQKLKQVRFISAIASGSFVK